MRELEITLNDCGFKRSLEGEQTIKLAEHPSKWAARPPSINPDEANLPVVTP